MADRGMVPGGVDEAAKLKEEKKRFKEEQTSICSYARRL